MRGLLGELLAQRGLDLLALQSGSVHLPLELDDLASLLAGGLGDGERLLRCEGRLAGLELRLERRDALLGGGEPLREVLLGRGLGELEGVLAALELGVQAGELAVLLCHAALGVLALAGHRGVHGARTLALGQLLAGGELPLELGVAHLAHDLRVLRLVDLEDLAAVRALDLCHDSPVLLVLP